MNILKSILGELKKQKSVSAKNIRSIVSKRSNTGLGGFVDLNNDLGLLLEENKQPEPGILMPCFYARRIAAAGMFSQGAINSQDFDRVEALFFNFMAQVGNEISKEEQVKFQEDSLDRAIELVEKYIVGVTRQSTQLLIYCVKQGISVRDALLEGLDVDDNELEEIVEPVMYRDWIMKSEYCMGFFAAGWWQPSDDFESSSEKILGYLKAIGLDIGNSVEPGSNETTNSEKPHFYTRGVSGEKLSKPIHIHFDSFKPAFTVNPNAPLSTGNSFDAIGTFLVTINSEYFGPKGLTCRVSGVNHTLTSCGVVDGVIAHVDMVKDIGEGPIERVHVELREDGSVVGQKEELNGYHEADLDEVFFSYGDTVYLDGDGNPFDEMNKPQPTMRQQDFARYEEEKRTSDLLDSLLNK